MKKNMLKGGFALAAIAGLFAFSHMQTSITGKVTPGDGAETVWAISGTDSVKSTVSSGSFAIPVKAGTYKVIVDAKDPYKDVQLESVIVQDGQSADVGEIILQK